MKRNCKILLIALMLFLILMPTMVKADSFQFNVKANKTSLKPGDTVELTIQLANIDIGNSGINTLEGILEYDTSIFEEVSQDSIQSLNNWSFTYNNEDTQNKGRFLAAILAEGVTKDQEIAKITLKVKSGVSYTNTTIKFVEIATNNEEELIKESDKQVTFEVGTKSSGNQTENTVKTNTTSNLIVEEQNLSQGTLPQTGSKIANVFFVIGAVALIIMAVAIFIRYRKMNE